MRKAILAVLLIAAPVLAQTVELRVYLDPSNGFSNTFAAAVAKKHVPVILTTDPDQATYLVNFTTESNGGSKARGITTALMTGVYADGSWDRVSMSIVDAKSKDVVFSKTCQKSGGHMQSAAECLAKAWGNHLEGKK